MVKKYFQGLFLFVNFGIFVLPLAISIMAIYSSLNPNLQHVELIREKSDGLPVLVGFEGGVQECVNSVCDNSKNNDTYTYIVWPNSFSNEKYFDVVNYYSGNVEVSSFTQNAYLWFGTLAFMLLYGAIMNLRLIKRINRYLRNDAKKRAS